MTEDCSVIQFGSRVRVDDSDGEVEFCVVEPGDADAVAERVSVESPLGRALIGRRVNDEVRFHAPARVLAVTVVRVNA